ncbi:MULTISPECIES: PIN domain-containing protein [unclassified Mucilaginibacter]|uniref:PIN domain-containing protein n=1 Tax=unclassified Mucilaginibacter TaxID=2617802 RepID=UPI00095D7F0F|nr:MULTISPECIES: PIN domain-containing protein [unclassified Mucilaginibacter]OJW13810.1 MAG: VapC toxin family PIN domain ribonuclease [Mucilaginibacter sp. 44-25]PLW88277.1 MAG: VapC toxin family PIN domain ribonuclease [Mucilaginibacter sp.]HEK22263.1 PIN domain-containing protein [Bacteroidota bacterium]
MSGDSIVVDTSLIINLFNGIEEVQDLLTGRTLFVSIISEIEVLSFSGLSITDKDLLRDFISKCHVVDIEPAIKELTIEIRAKSKVKLPAAIIAATAIYYDLPLFTMDKGFKRLDDLQAVILSL